MERDPFRPGREYHNLIMIAQLHADLVAGGRVPISLLAWDETASSAVGQGPGNWAVIPDPSGASVLAYDSIGASAIINSVIWVKWRDDAVQYTGEQGRWEVLSVSVSRADIYTAYIGTDRTYVNGGQRTAVGFVERRDAGLMAELDASGTPFDEEFIFDLSGPIEAKYTFTAKLTSATTSTTYCKFYVWWDIWDGAAWQLVNDSMTDMTWVASDPLPFVRHQTTHISVPVDIVDPAVDKLRLSCRAIPGSGDVEVMMLAQDTGTAETRSGGTSVCFTRLAPPRLPVP